MTVHVRSTRARLRRGFTLVELLIVVVIIGILATVAVPKYNRVRDRAGKGTMVADLRNLAIAEEGYYGEQNTYTTDLTLLTFRSSSGINIAVVQATPTGWAATANRPGVSSGGCAIFYGTATPVAPATKPGIAGCD